MSWSSLLAENLSKRRKGPYDTNVPLPLIINSKLCLVQQTIDFSWSREIKVAEKQQKLKLFI